MEMMRFTSHRSVYLFLSLYSRNAIGDSVGPRRFFRRSPEEFTTVPSAPS